MFGRLLLLLRALRKGTRRSKQGSTSQATDLVTGGVTQRAGTGCLAVTDYQSSYLLVEVDDATDSVQGMAGS